MLVPGGPGPDQGPPEPIVHLTIRPVQNGYILVTSPPHKKGKVFIATNLEEALTMSATMIYTGLETLLRGSLHEHQFRDYTLEDLIGEVTTLYTPKPPEDRDGALPI